MSIAKASQQEIDCFLDDYPQWSMRENKIHRAFVFNNFIEAFGFMTQSALIAERNDHHPQWSNTYKKVSVELMTHEAEGITSRDFDLAKAMDKIAEQYD